MTCVIYGAGACDGAVPPKDADLYIAADAGLDPMLNAGLTPDLLIGDFDSLTHPLPAGIPVRRLPVKKDVTDLDAAVREGLRRGCDAFLLYGVWGGRPDHSLANLTLLARLAKDGKRAYLFGGGFTVTAICGGSLTLPARPAGTAAVFSFTDRCEGVTIRGLQYGLEDARLESTFALGVSNAFIGEPAEISVREGILIIMYENA